MQSLKVWRNGNYLGHINKVKLRRAGPVTTRIGDHLWRYSSRTQPAGHRSTGIGSMRTADQFGHRWRRNGEFCVAVAPVIRNGWHTVLLCASITGSNSRRLKGQRGWPLPRDGPHSLCVNILTSVCTVCKWLRYNYWAVLSNPRRFSLHFKWLDRHYRAYVKRFRVRCHPLLFCVFCVFIVHFCIDC